ncbi:MAG: type II secretion system protein [Cyanobacteria bacterium P01_A01_bin.45]
MINVSFKKLILEKYFLAIKTKNKSEDTSGFTLLEVIVVVVIIGILSAIAAPSWIAFTKRQRLNKANDIVLSAIQDAQRQAKKTKVSYSVSFAVNADQPYFAVYRNNPTFNISSKNFSDRAYWKPLGEDIGIKPEEIWLGSKPPNSQLSILNNTNKIETVTFNYLGIPEDSVPVSIVTAIPKLNNKTQAGVTKRCVIIQTILGGTRIAKDNDCN